MMWHQFLYLLQLFLNLSYYTKYLFDLCIPILDRHFHDDLKETLRELFPLKQLLLELPHQLTVHFLGVLDCSNHFFDKIGCRLVLAELLIVLSDSLCQLRLLFLGLLGLATGCCVRNKLTGYLVVQALSNHLRKRLSVWSRSKLIRHHTYIGPES